MSIVRRGLGDFLHAPKPKSKPKSKPKRKPKPKPFSMYDSVTVGNLPRSATAVAGYVNGWYRTFPHLAEQFPHAKRLSIAVSANANAECLDIEQGDATLAQAPAWVRRQQARGIKKPVVYTSLANASALLSVLRLHGVKRADVRLWTAHYTNKPHRCSPLCGFGMWARADATQWATTSKLDISLCAPDFM